MFPLALISVGCPVCEETDQYPRGQIGEKITTFCNYPEVPYQTITCREKTDGTAYWYEDQSKCEIRSPSPPMKTDYAAIQFSLNVFASPQTSTRRFMV